MTIKAFRLDRKADGAHALEGLWGPVVGDLLYDMSAKGMGRGNHATRVGTGPRSQLSDRGRVLLFNGADDAWNCERTLAIGTRPFTLCAWVHLDTTVNTGASMVSQGDTVAGEWMFRISNSDAAGAAMFGFSAAAIAASAVAGTFHPAKHTWTHVGFTRTGGAAPTAHVYQNGLLMGTDATGAADLNTAKVLQIGCADSAATRWWEGMIDDVRYYSRALSLGQLAHIYNATRWTPYADILLRPTRRFVHRHRAEVL